MEKERLNTTIRKDIIKRLKMVAIEKEKRLTNVLEEAIIMYLEKEESKQENK
jgi:hypothetical protein